MIVHETTIQGENAYGETFRLLLYSGCDAWARSFQRIDFPHLTDKEFIARRRQTHLSDPYREAWDRVWSEEWDRRSLVRPASGFEPAASELLTPLP